MVFILNILHLSTLDYIKQKDFFFPTQLQIVFQKKKIYYKVLAVIQLVQTKISRPSSQ